MLLVTTNPKDNSDLLWNLVVHEAATLGTAQIQKGKAASVQVDADTTVVARNSRIRAVAREFDPWKRAQVMRWMSVDKVDGDLMKELESRLQKHAFLVDHQAGVADVHVALLLQGSEILPAAVSRWYTTTILVAETWAKRVGVNWTGPVVPPVSTDWWFATGDEDMAETLKSIHASSDAKQTKGVNKPQQNQSAKPNDKQQPKKAAAPTPPADGELDITALDLRVGKIVKIWPHAEAEKLFCEDIDMGEGNVRQVASGLRPFYKAEDLLNKNVVVVANLKKRNLVGFPSHGMVLCASSADKSAVEIVTPPDGTALGERLAFGELNGEAAPENKVAKKKLFEKLAPDLKTNGDGQVVWKSIIATTSAGAVKAVNGMSNAQVS